MIAVRRLTITALVVTIVGGALWRTTAARSRTHVVIITLDTTRADRLSP